MWYQGIVRCLHAQNEITYSNSEASQPCWKPQPSCFQYLYSIRKYYYIVLCTHNGYLIQLACSLCNKRFKQSSHLVFIFQLDIIFVWQEFRWNPLPFLLLQRSGKLPRRPTCSIIWQKKDKTLSVLELDKNKNQDHNWDWTPPTSPIQCLDKYSIRKKIPNWFLDTSWRHRLGKKSLNRSEREDNKLLQAP